MLPDDNLFVIFDTWRNPENNTNFFGRRKHMPTTIPTLHIVGHVGKPSHCRYFPQIPLP